MSDMVNSPTHYTQAGASLEPIDVIRDCPFDLGNVIKYASRAGHKDEELQDLRKAKRYVVWAAETYSQNAKHYEEWAMNKMLLLRKLRPFKHLNCYTAKKLIVELEHMIDNRLMELEDK